MQLIEYCSIAGKEVEIDYHTIKVPVLNKLEPQDGKINLDSCSFDDCNVSSIDCPLFRKLNNL